MSTPGQGQRLPEALAALIDELGKAANQVGAAPLSPPTLRGRLGRFGIGVINRILGWYTSQIRAFQGPSGRAHALEFEILCQLYRAVMRHERILNLSHAELPGEPPEFPIGAPPGAAVLDKVIDAYPTHQNALDIFRGEWTSTLPTALAKEFKAGPIPLFEDPRIFNVLQELGGIQNQRVLELGPLEGGHTYILHTHGGAGSVLSIESNTRAFLKCLIVKNMLKLDRAEFRCGDFVAFLRECNERFDFVLAAGVLYHMIEPVELLRLIGQVTDRVYIWTHYYDAELVSQNPEVARHFVRHGPSADGRYTLHDFQYPDWLRLEFTGGMRRYSRWMERGDILDCMRECGFHDLRIMLEDPQHVHGPSFGFLARKS